MLIPGQSSQSGRIPVIKGASHVNVSLECIVSKIFCLFVLISGLGQMGNYASLENASLEIDITNDVFRNYAVWRDKGTFPRENCSTYFCK